MSKIVTFIKLLPSDLFHTLFPDICLACDTQPKIRQGDFCVECLHKMPYTDHFSLPDNVVTKHFKGRVKLEYGAALLRFREGGIVQNMLHKLKYKKRKEIGEILGEIAGQKLMSSPLFQKPDLIIPIPIHYLKEKKRGYNQSSIFGKAVGRVLGVECREDIIIKSKWSESQTGKSRTQRVDNVEEVFELIKPELIQSRHVLIVDDVVTTGATIEACCMKLKASQVGKMSILTIAAAS
ncbi:MAG: ComF family protein [Saprospiraceae bacterium]|jgi:ComF family protein|nr:ComF family protein [Saprospiraceae bacterium]